MLARRFALLVQTALTTGMLIIPGCFGGDDNNHDSPAAGGTSSGGTGGSASGGRSGKGGSGGKSSTTTTGTGGEVSAGGEPAAAGGAGGTSDPGSGGAGGDSGPVDTTAPKLLSATLAANGSKLTLAFQAGEDLAGMTGIDPEKFRMSYAFKRQTANSFAGVCFSYCYSYSPYYCYTFCKDFEHLEYHDVGDFLASDVGQYAVDSLALKAANTIEATLAHPINVATLCTSFGANALNTEVGLYLHYTDDLKTGTQNVRDNAGHKLVAIAEDWATSPGNFASEDLGGGQCTNYCLYCSVPPGPCAVAPAVAPAFTAKPIKVNVTCN